MSVAPKPTPAPGITYSDHVRRYRDARGRYVSGARVREITEGEIEYRRGTSREDDRALAEGRIDLVTWQLRKEAALKYMHVATATIARGGVAHLNQADLGWIGARVKAQYAFLESFARDVEAGRYDRPDGTLDGRFLARADLYPESARNTAREMERRVAMLAGASRERWVLSTSEHCKGAGSCVEQANRGAVALGKLPKLGSRLCRSRCACRVMTNIDEDWYGPKAV